nr:hypothetical protein BaRGS_003396 [Batillaria attramentaria]
MLVSDYQSAKGNREAPEDDILSALSPLEKQLVNNFTRVELAKVSRLLLAAERGKISRFQGKSLDEIHMDEALEFSDSEEEGNECEDEEQHEPIDSS